MREREIINIAKWSWGGDYTDYKYECPYCGKQFKTYLGAGNCLDRCEKKHYEGELTG